MNRKYLRATGLAILAGLSALAFRPREEQATALFAGGCFWSMQKAFDGVPGVVDHRRVRRRHQRQAATLPRGRPDRPDRLRRVGAGGATTRPGSATSSLLDVYWHHIDPLTVNSAFCDRGPQYRSVIFYRDAAQKRLAEASKAALDRSQPLQDAGGDRDRAGHAVPAGRGVSPGVLQEVPRPLRGLPDRLPAGCSAPRTVEARRRTAQANTDKGWDPMTFTQARAEASSSRSSRPSSTR